MSHVDFNQPLAIENTFLNILNTRLYYHARSIRDYSSAESQPEFRNLLVKAIDHCADCDVRHLCSRAQLKI